jgi:hypothetical protein
MQVVVPLFSQPTYPPRSEAAVKQLLATAQVLQSVTAYSESWHSVLAASSVTPALQTGHSLLRSSHLGISAYSET